MPEDVVHRALARFRYALKAPRLRGDLGERMGRGIGSSIEFQDFREYLPGDDIRHVDWAAYARRDELVVRLYREEIAPLIEIVVDTSASMASTSPKEELNRNLLSFLCRLARADRLKTIVWFAGERLERIDRDIEARVDDLQFRGPSGLDVLRREPPRHRPRSIRVVLSDLLFAGEVNSMARSIVRDAAQTIVIQTLDQEEADPQFRGGTRLEDVEVKAALDLVVSEKAIANYRRRLENLSGTWRAALSSRGELLRARTDDDFEGLLSGALRRSGLLALRDHGGAS